MIERVEVQNFRMLKGNAVALRPFQVLVGQNATGKSTLLGALQFIGDLLEGGAHAAVERLAPSFYDLCFDRDLPLAFSVEISIPADPPRRLRYEVEVAIEEERGLKVAQENLFLLPSSEIEGRQGSVFGSESGGLEVIHETSPPSWRKVVQKTEDGRDYFRDETTDWNNVFRFGLDKAALGSLPEDPDRFPLSIAARDLLRRGIRTLALDARAMRSASPPGSSAKLALDGSNLPHVVRYFRQRDEILFQQWVAHVGTAVEGLEAIGVREREEDRHLVLEARFRGAHREPVPSWLLSDGTLRLLALTLLSYAAVEREPDIYLVEEPENGLHPLAIQVVFEALSQPSASSQFLCATHSPIFLAHTQLDQTLVFRRAPEGYSIVRRGPEIPELAKWSGRVDLTDLFVTGVLA